MYFETHLTRSSYPLFYHRNIGSYSSSDYDFRSFDTVMHFLFSVFMQPSYLTKGVKLTLFLDRLLLDAPKIGAFFSRCGCKGFKIPSPLHLLT